MLSFTLYDKQIPDSTPLPLFVTNIFWPSLWHCFLCYSEQNLPVISKPWRASKVSLSLDGFKASLRISIYLFLTPNLKESAILNQMLQLRYYFQIPDLLMMKTWTERISGINHKWVIIIGRLYTFFDRTLTDLFWNSHIKWLKWGEREIAPSWTFHFSVIFVLPVIPRCGARVGDCWMWYWFVSQSQHCLSAEFVICPLAFS